MNDATEIPSNLESLIDIPLNLSAELASCVKTAHELLRIEPGSVVEFDKSAKAPVNLYVNEKLVAFGEIVVVNEMLGIKVTGLAPRADTGGSPALN